MVFSFFPFKTQSAYVLKPIHRDQNGGLLIFAFFLPVQNKFPDSGLLVPERTCASPHGPFTQYRHDLAYKAAHTGRMGAVCRQERQEEEMTPQGLAKINLDPSPRAIA
jgi:hypothetical protein